MNYKKLLQITLLVLFFVSLLFPIMVSAMVNDSTPGGQPGVPLDYVLLAPLPEIGDRLSGENILETYLAVAFRIFISLAIVLTVIMIIIGGVQYLSTDAVSQKGEGKNKINNALTGLMLALLSVLLLTLIGGSSLTNFSIISPGLDPPPSRPTPPGPAPVIPSVDGCFDALVSAPLPHQREQYCEQSLTMVFTLEVPHYTAEPEVCNGFLNEANVYARTQCENAEGELYDDFFGSNTKVCLIERECL